MKWVKPQDTMNRPNIRNIQLNGRSLPPRMRVTSTSGMARYASQMAASETLCSPISPCDHSPQPARGTKPPGRRAGARSRSFVPAGAGV